MLNMNVDVLIPTINKNVDIPINILESDIGSGRIIFSYAKPLINARMELIRKSKSEYIFFLDDDVKYNRGLIPYLFRYMNDNIGALQGITYPKGLGSKWDIAIFNYLDKHLPIKSLIKNNGISRFYTNNTLIKTSLVKDWIGDLNASGFEDLSLTRHIQNKGFKCCRIKTPFLSFHDYSWIKVLRNTTKWRNGYFYCMGLRMFIIRLIKMNAHLIKTFLMYPVNIRYIRFWVFQSWINISSIIGSLLFIIKKGRIFDKKR